MPNYGYRCQPCQREFEIQQRMSEPPQAACPDCGGAGTRLFYPTGILFKGSGFYKTDSRSTPAATPPAGADATKPTADAPKPDADASSEAVRPVQPAKESAAAAPARTSTATSPAATPSKAD